MQRKVDARNKDHALDPYLDDQFTTGRLFACISSRPGQCGRADGWASPCSCRILCMQQMQSLRVSAVKTTTGHLLASISSQPWQCSRADGWPPALLPACVPVYRVWVHWQQLPSFVW